MVRCADVNLRLPACVTVGMGSKSFSTTTVVSGGIISVDADELAKAAMYLEVPAGLVDDALKRWQSNVQQIGPAWGTGGVAEELQGQYAGPAEKIQSVLSGLVVAFETVGGSVHVTASSVADTEEVNNS